MTESTTESACGQNIFSSGLTMYDILLTAMAPMGFKDVPEPVESVEAPIQNYPYNPDFEDYDRYENQDSDLPVKGGRVNGHAWRSAGDVIKVAFKCGEVV